MEEKAPVVVVWIKSKTAAKKYMTFFQGHNVDDVIEEKRKPLLDNNYDLDEVGVGSSFIEFWQLKFDINKYNIIKK